MVLPESFLDVPGCVMSEHLFGKLRSVGIAAPASGCDPEKLRAGIKFLEQQGLKIIPGKNLFSKGVFSYLSADDLQRAEDFNSLAENPEVDAILCVRGGYGTPRILEKINYAVLRQRNLPVIGFSDITALHLAMMSRKAGICVASQMAVRLPEAVKCAETFAGIKRVYAVLSGEKTVIPEIGSPMISLNGSDQISGGVIPLNLTLVSSLCGTDYLPSMQGKIVILEEIGEPVRKIDRMLQQLYYSNFFKGVSGVVFAQFSDCGEEQERNALFREFAQKVSVPVFSGLAYGHDLPSHSFVFNELCRIENGKLHSIQ